MKHPPPFSHMLGRGGHGGRGGRGFTTDLFRFPVDFSGYLARGFALISLLSTKPSFGACGAHGHDQITTFDKVSHILVPKLPF